MVLSYVLVLKPKDMTKSVAVIMCPNYKDYASRYLQDCLQGLRNQTFHEFDIFLIDNETSEKSFSLLQSLAPDATILRREHNDGFAGGNNVALKEILEKEYEYALLVNMDTEVETTCLEYLVQAMKEHPQAGAIQARIMLHPEKEVVNSLGNETHFLGFGYSRGYKERYKDQSYQSREIAYPSGAGVMLRVYALRTVGCFDEELWMYNEDQDLGWRLWLAGFSCLLAPKAVIYHKYEFSRSIQKYYWLDRNRVIVMLKNYHWLTLLLLIPAFIIMEGGLVMFALAAGYGKEKLRVWRYFFSIKNWKHILQKRRVIQGTRVTTERKIASLLTGKIWYQEIGSVKLKIANIFLGLYWQIVKLVIWW